MDRYIAIATRVAVETNSDKTMDCHAILDLGEDEGQRPSKRKSLEAGAQQEDGVHAPVRAIFVNSADCQLFCDLLNARHDRDQIEMIRLAGIILLAVGVESGVLVEPDDDDSPPSGNIPTAA